MKNSDEAIDAVLAGLRDAESPEGMERRILRALENGRPVRAGSVWHRMLPLWLLAPTGAMTRVLVGGAASAGVIVIVFAASAIRHAGDVAVRSKKEVVSAKVFQVAPSIVGAPLITAPSSDHMERARLRVRIAPAETRSLRTVDSEDSVALSEMRAASFSAPPMPLTDQEKLLLRIAHRGDPVEVAMLDSNQRNLEEMKEKAEYQSFFARPVIKQPTTEQVVLSNDSTEEKQLEEQQQIPSGDDNKNDNGKNNGDNNGRKKGETE